MPSPVTVWMVRLERGGDLREIQGTLRMDEDAVVFVDRKTEAETRVPFESTRKVRRVFGSPVLVLDWHDGFGRSETAFYFVQPPPMPTERGGPMSEGTALQQPPPTVGNVFRRPSRRRQRRESIGYLAARSRAAKDTIKVWAEEIRTRSRA